MQVTELQYFLICLVFYDPCTTKAISNEMRGGNNRGRRMRKRQLVGLG
jgi:hypothetical protein